MKHSKNKSSIPIEYDNFMITQINTANKFTYDFTKSKELRKLKEIEDSIKNSKKLVDKHKYVIQKRNLLKALEPEDYREFLKSIETYFHMKNKLLQYLFPYIIEYGKMQSKFTTTRYYNNINMVVPFIYDYFNVVTKSNALTYHSHQLQYKEEENYHFINRHRSNNRMPDERLKGSFYLYKTFFFALKELIFLQKRKHELYTERKNPNINKDMVIQYHKQSDHSKFPRYIWTIIFQDPIIEKFTNLFMKHGNKSLAESMVLSMFFQFHNYMYINPLFIFKTAIENVRPYVCSKSIPFGRRTKVVPHPINEKQQIKLSMKWIKQEALSIKGHYPLPFKLMEAILNAYFKKGYAYNQMLSLHNEAYTQRAYMYSNYYLRSSKVKHKRPF